MKKEFGMRKAGLSPNGALIAHVNRKSWWHVTPRDPRAYAKRGRFFASTYREAEFWGLPLMEPERVSVARPLIGDETSIETKLFGKRVSRQDIGIEERFRLDARMKRVAAAKGYDSILLMSRLGFAQFKQTQKIPRSLELNILNSPLKRVNA